MAELALAIVPIFLSAVKGFSILREKTHVLRHYHKEIKRLRDKVEVQSRNFSGEVHQLIIDTLDDHTAQSLINDDEHKYWKSQDLDAALKRHLGARYPEFAQTMEEVRIVLNQVQTRLSVFAPPDVSSPLFRATKDRFRLLFKKEEYKEDIATIKEWIKELKRIRKLAHRLRSSSTLGAGSARTLEENRTVSEVGYEPDLAAVKQYRTVQRLSSKLQSLAQQWRCSHASHSHHVSRLFVGASSQQSAVLWLLETSGRQGNATIRNRLFFSVISQQMGLLTPESIEQMSFDEPDQTYQPSAKRQRVSMQEHVPAPANAGSGADDTQNLCRRLEACVASSRARSVHHFDPQIRERFQFEAKDMGAWSDCEVSSAAELFYHPVDEVLNQERVKLAIALVRYALANHSTAAWPQGCVLEGISFLKKPNTELDVSAVLDSLNLQVELGGSRNIEMDLSEGSVVSEDELQFTYGIQNRILYRLGVALLSIGLWTRVNWRDIAAVRRKAAALDSLGKEYRETVKRLIWGNFDVEEVTNLGDERLQAEILRTVIGPLQKRAEPRRQRRTGGGGTQDRWPGHETPRWHGEPTFSFPVR
ncbi:hypothetical protein QBC47DRAFT_375640 [Echria macrotheca]|uniref:Uncharacterized protein n=1 Tax=Echria macrotheca TaxID=438768 RepID=A0AAJ0FBF0_9PEZI|nr:hypothetical protein QBC47DRAFT_375640 [Echria macrotheca]